MCSNQARHGVRPPEPASHRPVLGMIDNGNLSQALICRTEARHPVNYVWYANNHGARRLHRSASSFGTRINPLSAFLQIKPQAQEA
jgi:hypothetical protein